MTENQPQTQSAAKKPAASPKEIYTVEYHSTEARTKSAVLKELILARCRSSRDETE